MLREQKIKRYEGFLRHRTNFILTARHAARGEVIYLYILLFVVYLMMLPVTQTIRGKMEMRKEEVMV